MYRLVIVCYSPAVRLLSFRNRLALFNLRAPLVGRLLPVRLYSTFLVSVTCSLVSALGVVLSGVLITFVLCPETWGTCTCTSGNLLRGAGVSTTLRASPEDEPCHLNIDFELICYVRGPF